MPSKSVKWHDDWLIENYLNYESYQKLADAYNEKFSDYVTKSGINNHCLNKLKLKKPRQNIRHYTEEQREWLKENLPKYGRKETCRKFNERFNETRTVRAMKTFTAEYGIKVDEAVWKKHVAETVNKNKIREVGSIRIQHGRKVIKVAKGERWQFLNRVVYEAEHGKIPSNYCVTHLDNNPMNCDISNLVALPKSVLMTMTGANLKSEDPRITEVAITWCKLKLLLEKGKIE